MSENITEWTPEFSEQDHTALAKVSEHIDPAVEALRRVRNAADEALRRVFQGEKAFSAYARERQNNRDGAEEANAGAWSAASVLEGLQGLDDATGALLALVGGEAGADLAAAAALKQSPPPPET